MALASACKSSVRSLEEEGTEEESRIGTMAPLLLLEMGVASTSAARGDGAVLLLLLLNVVSLLLLGLL